MKEDLFPPLKSHKLKPLLKEHDIRQSQAAAKLGVSLHYLNDVLNGHVKPSRRLNDAMSNLVTEMKLENSLSERSKNGK